MEPVISEGVPGTPPHTPTVQHRYQSPMSMHTPSPRKVFPRHLYAPQYESPGMSTDEEMMNSPQLHSQMMQLQSQMQLLSQMAASQQAVAAMSPMQHTSPAKDPMLCFKLGERVGALHKHEEATKEALSSVSTQMRDVVQDISETQRKLILVEAVQDQGRVQLQSVERELQALSASATERAHQLSDCQKDLKHERETRTLALQEAQAKLKALTQVNTRLECTMQAIEGQLVGMHSDFANDRGELKELRKRALSFADSLNRMHAQISVIESNSENDREQLKRTMKEFKDAVNTTRAHTNQDMKQLEKKYFAQFHAQTQQMETLKLELLRVSGGDGSTGWLPVLAQIALPFISTERLSVVLDAITQLKPFLVQHIRKIWFGLLFVDLSTRVAEQSLPRGMERITSLLGVTTPGYAFKVARAVFEIALLFQVLIGAQRVASESLVSVRGWIQVRRTALLSKLRERPSKRTVFMLAALFLVLASSGVALSPTARQFAVMAAISRVLPPIRGASFGDQH